MNWLFDEPNPIALNTIMAMTGMSHPVFRAPYWPYSKEKREKGIELLQAFQAHEICGGRPQVMDDGDFSVLSDWSRGAQHIKGNNDSKSGW